MAMISSPFIVSLAINASGDVFAGTFEGGGVYRSTDNGESWTLTINGLANTYVLALATNADGDIFAGTAGTAFFVRPTTGIPGRKPPPGSRSRTYSR